MGSPPSLGVTDGLNLGRTTMLIARNMPSPAIGALVAGWATDQWGSFHLPLSLASMGMTGCLLYVRPDAIQYFSSNSSFAQWQLPVPYVPVLQGAELGVQTLFVDAQANAAGVGATPGLGLRIQPPETQTAVVSQVTQNGITFVFAQPSRVGQFVNGDWFVLGPVAIVDMLPQVVNVGGRVMNGAMVNPSPATVNQGYDSNLYTAQFANFYQPALNRALGVSPQAPLLLLAGDALVKVESLVNPPGIANLQRAAVLTCLADVPYAGSFRPPYAGTDHTVRYHMGMIDWSKLANLQPASGMPLPSEVAAKVSRVWLDHCPSWLGRMMHPQDNMPDYGRDLAALIGEAALMTNCALPEVDRREITAGLVQIGIDCYGNLTGGCRWPGLGGHASGRKLPILYAGTLLGDAGMLAIGRNYVSQRQLNGASISYFGEDSQTFTVQETAPGVYNWGYGGYTAADVGLAEWGFSHTDSPQNDHSLWTADSYRICCTVNGWIGNVLAARIMGLRSDWNHQVLFDYSDHYMGTETTPWTRSWLPWVDSMWLRYRPQY